MREIDKNFLYKFEFLKIFFPFLPKRFGFAKYKTISAFSIST